MMFNKTSGAMLAVLVACIFVVSTVKASDASAPSCSSFPVGWPDYTRFCDGVVDYDFYLPANTTQSMLNVQALGMVDPSWLNMPASCQSSLKRMICAEVYLPCASSEVTEKPCKGVCEAVETACTPTPLAMLGVDCDKNKTDAVTSQQEPVYAPDGNGTCNTMSSTLGVDLVASTSEPYIGSYCADVIDYAIIVPPAPMLDPSFAPMMGPYVVQSMIEYAVVTSDDSVPKWLPKLCLAATKVITCGSAFVQRYEFEIFPGVTSDLPSYPHRDYCEDIGVQCGQPMDCNATVPGTTMQMYPSRDQTIMTLDLSAFGMSGTLDLDAPPNTALDVNDADVTVICPSPWLLSYEDDEVHDTTILFPNTGCAMPADSEPTVCQDTIVPEALWSTLKLMLISLAALNLVTTPAKKRGPWHIGVIVGIACCNYFLMWLATLIQPSQQYNDISAYAYNDLDKFSVFMFYVDFIFFYCIMEVTLKGTALELYMRVVWETKKALYIMIPVGVLFCYNNFYIIIPLLVKWSSTADVIACPSQGVPIVSFDERSYDYLADWIIIPYFVLSMYAVGHALGKLCRMAYLSGGMKAVLTSFKTYSSLWALTFANVLVSSIIYHINNMEKPVSDYVLGCHHRICQSCVEDGKSQYQCSECN